MDPGKEPHFMPPKDRHLMPTIRQLAYISSSKLPLEPTLLSDILDVSVRNNTNDKITGVLMHHDMLWFQILEGDASLVGQCYQRICDDDRHTNISLTLDCTVESRAFPSWNMGYVGPDEIGAHSGHALKSLDDLRPGEMTLDRRHCAARELSLQMFKTFQER